MGSVTLVAFGQHACLSPAPPSSPTSLKTGHGRDHKGGGPKDCSWAGSSSRFFATPGVGPAQLQQQTDHIKANPLLWGCSCGGQLGSYSSPLYERPNCQ